MAQIRATAPSQPCIRGTRVLVTVVLDVLAAGMSAAEIVEHYPTLTVDNVRAAAAYGAWLAKQEISTRCRRPREDQARREHHRRKPNSYSQRTATSATPSPTRS